MMKYIFQSILFVELFFFVTANAGLNSTECIELSGNEVFIPSRLGSLSLYKDFSGFHIRKDGEIYDIQNYNCNAMLQDICAHNQLNSFLGRNKPIILLLTPEDLVHIEPQNIIEISEAQKSKLLNQFLAPCGYIAVSQMDNGEYILRANMRLLGGVKAGNVALAGGTGLAGGSLAATGIVASAGAMSGTVGTALTVIPSVAALEAAIPGLAAGLSMAPGATIAGAGGSILATGTTQTLLGAGIAAVGWPITLGIVGAGGIIGLVFLLVDSTATPATPHENPTIASPVKTDSHKSITKKTDKNQDQTTAKPKTTVTKKSGHDKAVYEPEMLNHKIRDQLREAIKRT